MRTLVKDRWPTKSLSMLSTRDEWFGNGREADQGVVKGAGGSSARRRSNLDMHRAIELVETRLQRYENVIIVLILLSEVNGTFDDEKRDNMHEREETMRM